MEIYIPDLYQQDIYNIDYEALISRGIKCLIFDLDNTLVPIKETEPREETKKLFKKLKSKGFKLVIASNSIKVRVKPFYEELKTDYVVCCRKPKPDKINEYVKKSKYRLDQIAMIGDSMIDDITCGNTIGVTTVLLDQISKKEFPLARLRRIKEHRVQKKLRDKDLFVKGRYYV